MFTTDSSTGGGAGGRMLESVPMASLAAVETTHPIPPQNHEAEESVLGAMMISANAIGAVSEIVDAGDFYRESHGRIFRAAIGLYQKGEPVDVITLTAELEERGEIDLVGGRVRLHELAALVPATGNAEHYARIVHETATLRGLIRAGTEISKLGWEHVGEPTELVARAEQIVYELGERDADGNLMVFRETLNETFERISHLYETRADVTGVPSGFKDLDAITAGFQPSNLVVLAARPSMGKSALALSIVANVVLRSKLTCALFSLEMSRQEIAQRFICMEGKIDSHRIRTGQLTDSDWPRLIQACSQLEHAPLYVDDTAGLNLLELRTRLQTLKRRQQDLSLVVVDYMQLMTMPSSLESRLQEVSAISRGLKEIARDFDVPVLALSQLSRAVEQRTDKRPILSDLRESGGIEQDADLVMFIYRDDYYNAESEQKGLAEVHVAKHRNGPTDTMKLTFLRSHAKFSSVHS
ncbi:MAG: replicative DNA helicase [Gaiellaceae bacterium]